MASAAAAARTPARSLGDLYGILGVPRDASQGEIKKAYYDRSKELHPDHNQNDEEASKRFARVNEAYSVLSNVRACVVGVRARLVECAREMEEGESKAENGEAGERGGRVEGRKEERKRRGPTYLKCVCVFVCMCVCVYVYVCVCVLCV